MIKSYVPVGSVFQASATHIAVCGSSLNRLVFPARALSPPFLSQVPAYLIKRQAEMHAEEERKLQAEADKDVPPGMIRMSEDERQKTLELLRTNKASIDEEYRRLPFRIETPSQIERQTRILEKIKEIDDAIKVFSRSPVYISA